jgi:hypothetical protein
MAYDPNLMITHENRATVIAELIALGEHPAALHGLTNIALANLYHTIPRVASPDDVQRATSAAIATIMAAWGARPIQHGPLVIAGPRGNVQLETVSHYKTELVIKIAALGHAILMVGPAGCGKTTIAEHVAKALQLPFYITSTINDTHELMGFVDGHGKYHDTPFRNAFERGGVWCADEIDAWDASALLAANSALANGLCTFPDLAEPLRRHADFRMVATANTFGTGADRVYVGRNELDAASLDRFATVDVDYDLDLERMFANGADEWLDNVWRIRKIVQEKRIRHVVSSRAIAMGAAALRIGIDWADVEDIYLYKGMSESDRKKIDG